MPAITVNVRAVLVAGISSLVIGSLRYGPLFGKQRMKLMNFTSKQIEEGKKGGMKMMRKMYLIQFIASLVTAYVLTHIITFSSAFFGTNYTALQTGLMSGFRTRLGFQATLGVQSVLREGKPRTLYFLNAGHNLVNLLVMGTILSCRAR